MCFVCSFVVLMWHIWFWLALLFLGVAIAVLPQSLHVPVCIKLSADRSRWLLVVFWSPEELLGFPLVPFDHKAQGSVANGERARPCVRYTRVNVHISAGSDLLSSVMV
jgi:hypothetical protein